MRVMMSGGGTAGHIYPALTVAGLLLESGPNEVTFVGTPQGLEARLVPEAGVSFVPLPAKGFDRAKPYTLLTSSVLLGISTVRAAWRILRTRPDVVVGFGGYVSIPVGFGALLTRTPLVLHEQNSVPGLANRVLSRWASAVGVTYSDSVGRLARADRAVVTGNPVRPAVLDARRETGRGSLGVPPEATMLLVFGGSRGARHINEAMAAAARRILAIDGVHVVHATGSAELETVRRALGTLAEEPAYHLVEYIDDMGSALAACDLVVSRAGATSLAEITALGRPAVLIPYPFATDDHQTLNAVTVVNAGGAVLTTDKELDSAAFVETVTSLLCDGQRRATMATASKRLGRPQAGREVVEMIERVAHV